MNNLHFTQNDGVYKPWIKFWKIATSSRRSFNFLSGYDNKIERQFFALMK